MRDAEFNDPRLLAVYDEESPWGPADDYFLAVAGATPAARVLDLGCGTGRLALGLADAGHVVTGLDPSAAALAVAQARPGAWRVSWIHGTAAAAPAAAFDVAIMNGHVAQFLLTDEEWIGTLRDVWTSLAPGGRLAFHAYDPAGRIWTRWNPVDSRRRIELADGTAVLAWTEVTELHPDAVSYAHTYRFGDRAELRSESTLRFRDEAQLRRSVSDAGFSIERVDGGWQGQPVGSGDGELIVVARR